MSKWITFKERNTKKKTKHFNVYASTEDYRIGVIKWYPNWRQYCFFPEVGTLYNSECMNDIADFIKGLMNERKESKKGTNRKDPG
jgi:hypothetical protein